MGKDVNMEWISLCVWVCPEDSQRCVHSGVTAQTSAVIPTFFWLNVPEDRTQNNQRMSGELWKERAREGDPQILYELYLTLLLMPEL